MSAVTVALLLGFVCCALLIRALRTQGDELEAPSIVIDDRGSKPGRSMPEVRAHRADASQGYSVPGPRRAMMNE